MNIKEEIINMTNQDEIISTDQRRFKAKPKYQLSRFLAKFEHIDWLWSLIY